MSDTDDRSYRTRHRSAPGEVELRAAVDEDADDGLMAIRMPIASTGEVRNEGDEPLTARELDGMAEQVNDLTTGVFPEHGASDAVDGGQYSQFEKLGYWASADVEREAAADGADLLMATARMPDPETLPAATGDYREALAILKSQAERGIPIDASIGWREADDYPGGNDLMEASIVGIGADPRTNTAGADPVATVTRAAVDAGADAETLVAAVRDAVETERPLGPPEDPERFDTFDECVAELSDDPTTSREEAERICGSWEAAKDEQAATHNIDDPEFSEGDAVRWSSQDTPVHGRVAGVHEQYSPNDNVTITGDDGEAVYSIYEWDDSLEPPRFQNTPSDPNIAKPQSSLSESGLDMPPATAENFEGDTENSMTDTDESGDDPDADAVQDAPDDGDETTRAPEDVTPDDLFTFVAIHLDGMDESDLAQAVDAADAEYIGEADPEALADLISVVCGCEYGDAMDALEMLMTEADDAEQEYDEDGEKVDDEDEDDEDDGEMSADASALAERVAELESELDAVREGTLDLDGDADTDTDTESGETASDTEQTRDSGPVNVADHFN